MSTPPSAPFGMSILQLKLANCFAFCLTQFMSFLAARGTISELAVGEVSDMYPTKISPAGGAFSIWISIYLIEFMFLVYQFFWPKEDETRQNKERAQNFLEADDVAEQALAFKSTTGDEVILKQIGLWFVSVCMFNAAWICTFVQGTTFTTWVSTIIIAGLLFSLCKIYVNTGCWTTPRAPFGSPLQVVVQAFLIDVHFTVYTSWVTVATIANTAIAMTSVWSAEPATASACSVGMLIVAFALAIFIVLSRRDCAWGWVFSWASFWIYAADYGDAVNVTAMTISVLSGLVSAAVGGRTAVKWYKGISEAGQDGYSEGD